MTDFAKLVHVNDKPYSSVKLLDLPRATTLFPGGRMAFTPTELHFNPRVVYS